MTAVPGGAPETMERFGRLVRHFPVAVSVGAMAGAWARQEEAPARATVVVDHEISALGRMGRPWEAAPESTLALATVLRPPVAPEEADVAWLVGALGVMEGAGSVAGRDLGASWPDVVVDAQSGATVAGIKVESQLGPGQVRAAVVTVRLDLMALGLEASRRDELLEAVVRGMDEPADELAEGPQSVAAAYQRRCVLVDKRLKVQLLPRGETRGTVTGVDRGGRLELASATGMTERISVDMLRELQVV